MSALGEVSSLRSGPPSGGGPRLGDLVSVPGLLSLARIPLAIGFTLLADHPAWRLVVLLLGGLSDVLDGWYARRFRQVTTTGAVLDPITDKFFVLVVAASLILEGRLSLGAVILLSTRELGELPLVVWFAVSPRARKAQAANAVSNWAGKAVTSLQFFTVGLTLFENPIAPVVLAMTAILGILAAVIYWRRAVLRTPLRKM